MRNNLCAIATAALLLAGCAAPQRTVTLPAAKLVVTTDEDAAAIRAALLVDTGHISRVINLPAGCRLVQPKEK